jgi:hypothetical protein
MSRVRVADHTFGDRRIRARRCLHSAAWGYDSSACAGFTHSAAKSQECQKIPATEHGVAEAQAVPLGSIPGVDLHKISTVLGPAPGIGFAQRVRIVVTISRIVAACAAK